MEQEAIPNMVEVFNVCGQNLYVINFDFQTTDEGTTWNHVELPLGNYGYGTIVSHIIQSHYSDNEIEAINANMLAITVGLFDDLSAEKIEEYKQEFKELCLWREHAKEVATEALKYIEN